MKRERRISEIYKKINAPIDRLPRNLENDRDLLFGETSPQAVEAFLSYKRLLRDRVFYDLGSGWGSVVLQAGMYTGIHGRFNRVVGIEINPKRHKVAQQAFEIAQAQNLLKAQVELRQSDFFTSDISDGDFIYVNATSFKQSTLEDLLGNFERLAKGSRVVLADRELVLSNFNQIAHFNAQINYQRGFMNIYEKIE